MMPSVSIDALPPEVREQFEEQQRRVKQFQDEDIRLGQEIISELYRFAGLTCNCRRWFNWSNRSAPQYDCSIHGNMINTLIWLDYQEEARNAEAAGQARDKQG